MAGVILIVAGLCRLGYLTNFIFYASMPRVVVLGRTAGGDFIDVDSRPGLTHVPGMLLVRPDGALFFGNADRVRHAVTALVSECDPGRAWSAWYLPAVTGLA